MLPEYNTKNLFCCQVIEARFLRVIGGAKRVCTLTTLYYLNNSKPKKHHALAFGNLPLRLVQTRCSDLSLMQRIEAMQRQKFYNLSAETQSSVTDPSRLAAFSYHKKFYCFGPKCRDDVKPLRKREMMQNKWINRQKQLLFCSIFFVSRLETI